ncbi:MAG: branched-chain amino acid ABC transporter permease [Clostridiales bacterium]|nr:branched-chain amino acid ABC transporter permease [Clostridiales bacterium]
MSIFMFVIAVMTIVGIYAMMALCYNLTNGQTGIVDFGVIGWVAIGAYTYAIITSPDPSTVAGAVNLYGFHLPMWIGLIAAMITAAFGAFCIGLPTLRLRGEYLAIGAYALSMVITSFITNEAWLTNGSRGFFGMPAPLRDRFTSVSAYAIFFLLLIWAFVLGSYFLFRRIEKSPYGRILRSIRENEEVSISIGKNVWKYRMTAYVLAAAILGLVGVLYAWYASVLVPEMFTDIVTFTVVICVILGGTGNFKGSLLGATVMIGAQELTRFFQANADMAATLAATRIIAIGILLVLIIRFKRRGILPEKNIKM